MRDSNSKPCISFLTPCEFVLLAPLDQTAQTMDEVLGLTECDFKTSRVVVAQEIHKISLPEHVCNVSLYAISICGLSLDQTFANLLFDSRENKIAYGVIPINLVSYLQFHLVGNSLEKTLQ
jgi:hypothetical protein